MLMRPDDCCVTAMNEVDLEGVRDGFYCGETIEQGVFLKTGYKCRTCSQNWERFVEMQDPDEVRWDAIFYPGSA